MLKGLKKCAVILDKSPKSFIQTCCITTGRIPSTAPVLMNLQPAEKFSPGCVYEGFACIQSKYIPDFNMTAYMFEHEILKSKYLHIDRNDPNNLFSINFRTTPFNSTGIPHILEHNVLCGSEKFPVRDPFFKMINRSVATFMNAMTGPDYTMYPFSSMNERDFRNLQTIYMDAVFKPNLKYLDFLQEGWRLENTDLKNINSDYIIKGVVYNEMKGAFSENSAVFTSTFLNKILPDHTYGHCSGGDPLVIPSLTHEELVAFHQTYYHPSNARFFSYGNFNLEPTLQYVNTEYLSKFKPIDSRFSQIPVQKRWTVPQQQNITCRFDNMGAPIERQNQIAVGYLMSDITNVYETMVLNVLTELLMKGPNSRIYKNLIEPNISGGYSQATGFESSIRDTLFVVGLQDVHSKDFDKILDIFNKTIEEVIKDGFDPDHVESVLNNMELSLKHQIPKFGLGLLFNVTPILNHDGDAIQSLQYGALIAELRKNLQNPRYLQEKVQQYFKNNNHRLVLTMTPDIDHEKKFSEKEKDLITSKVKHLTTKEKEKVFENGQALAKSQKSVQSLDVLPCLSLSDVEKPPQPYLLEDAFICGIPTQIVQIDTNNVTYIHGIYNASKLSIDQKLLLPLLAHIIDQMGTKNFDYPTFDKYVISHTSGIDFRPVFSEHVHDLSKYSVGLMFKSYCLEQNIPKMFEIAHELIKGFNFNDITRFEMLMKNYVSALSVGIADSGHIYAMQSAAGLVCEAGKLKAQLSSIEHIDFMKNLVKTLPPSEILNKLKEIASILFNESSLKCALNTSPKTHSVCMSNYTKFLESITSEQQSQKPKWEISKILPPMNLHNVMTIPVNYCAKSILTVPYNHEDFAPLQILGKILSSKYLLPVVREQNGAYGSGAKISESGIFSFYSYRDPNTKQTLDTFDASANWIKDNGSKIDDQVLFEAKLGVLQSLDAPVGPGSKGLDYFKYGISQDIYIEHRRKVLAVNHDDLYRVTEIYLKDRSEAVGKFVLGPENASFVNGEEKWTVKQS